MFRRLLAAAAMMVLLSPVTPAAQADAAPVPAAPADAQVRGVLLDSQGLPAAGYQIGLQSPAGDLFISAPTGPDGAFAVEGIPAGTYRLVALSPDGSEFPVLSKKLNLKPGQVERMELKLGRSARMPGTAAAGETPAAGARPGLWNRIWGTTAGKVAVVVVGAGALALALDDDDDDDEEGKPPVSPSVPR
ncbi:MAG: carboxypeptidase regulatory-like domain-containing protein [Acidobacteria bacterium]|nr:carboxypeptidase regulatory-like domain-containing protein [Acidobacteriota bacterium]